MWLKGNFEFLISNSILLEYEEVLNRPKFDFPKWAVANLLYIFLKQASKVSPSQLHNVIIEDQDDNKFIDCALEGKAKYIITDDPHLLKLKEFESIKIVSQISFETI